MDNATIKEWMQEGVTLHLAGRRAEAETQYRKVLEAGEDNPVVHNNLGFLLAQGGQWEDAIGEYSRAIALSPEYSTAYTNLGQALLSLNRISEAGAPLSRAIMLDPENLYANEAMGKLCLLDGDLAASEQFLKKSYALAPKNETLYSLVVCLLGQSKVDEAKEVLISMRSAGRNEARWHNLLGLVHFSENNFGEAGRCFRQSLGLEPENTGVRGSLAVVLLKTGSMAEAMAEYRRILQLEPAHLGTLLNLGVLELTAGKYEAALESLDKALAIEPANNKGLYYKAVVLTRQNKKTATAKNLLQKVIRSADAEYSGEAAKLLKELTN